MKTIEITLQDASGQNQSLKARIEVTDHTICIYFDGYGEKSAAPGHGTPIYVENVMGIPKLYVWGDINEEEPTHTISLDDAAEENRKEE